MNDFLLVGVVGEIENSDLSRSVILKIGTREECIDFFKLMNTSEKEAFVEIFVTEKSKFDNLVQK